jgi:hypothetical protein
VIGTRTTETVPLSVTLTDPPMTGTLQAQVTETVALVATTSSAIALELQLTDPHTEQIQTASPPQAPTKGQCDSSESEEDTSQFLLTPRSSAPDSTASIPPSDP